MTKQIQLCIGIIAVTLGCIPFLALGLGPVRIESFDGQFWSRHVVLVAEVQAVIPNGDQKRPSEIHVNPLASLSGNLDPAGQDLVRADFYYGPSATVTQAPAVNSIVIVLLQRRDSDEPLRAGTQYVVETGICAFMPGGGGIAQIDGLGDPRVDAVVRAIRKSRSDNAGKMGRP